LHIPSVNGAPELKPEALLKWTGWTPKGGPHNSYEDKASERGDLCLIPWGCLPR
jgi:hypothetical protein